METLEEVESLEYLKELERLKKLHKDFLYLKKKLSNKVINMETLKEIESLEDPGKLEKLKKLSKAIVNPSNIEMAIIISLIGGSLAEEYWKKLLENGPTQCELDCIIGLDSNNVNTIKKMLKIVFA